MKKLYILLLMVLGVGLNAYAQTCDHTKMTPVDTNGKVVFKCDNCGVVDYTTWYQIEDMGITNVDPYLDTQADLHDLGKQQCFFTSTNSILEAWLLRDSDGKLLAYKDQNSKPQPMVQFTLPATYTSCQVTAVFALKKSTSIIKADNSIGMKEETVYAVKHTTYKPFHRIRSFEVHEVPNKNKNDIMKPYTRILFSTDAPDDEDVMSSDQFIVYRSKTPDFASKEAVAYFQIGSPTYTTTEDGQKIGWYMALDKDEKATYNSAYSGDTLHQAITEGASELIDNQKFSDLDKHVLEGFYTHPNQPVYYRVERALVSELWSTHYGVYILNDSINASSQLPSASRVKVTQDRYWGSNKKVTLQVQLDNPHPWEYNELEDATTIKSELQNNAMAYRRYVWNNDAKIRVTRYAKDQSEWDNGKDPAALEYVISGKDVKWVDSLGCWIAEVKDCQSLARTHYYYKAIVEKGSSAIPLAHNNSYGYSTESDANKSYSDNTVLITEFTASQDEHVGRVALKWQLGVGTLDKVQIWRREYSVNREKDEWTLLTAVSQDQTEYEDVTALSGHAYQYKLTTIKNYRQETIQDSCIANGWASYRSSISGILTMPNGTGMSSRQLVLTRKTPVFIDDVKDENGNVIRYGFHDGVVADAPARAPEADIDNGDVLWSDTIMTDESGRFRFENLPFMGDGTKYELNLGRLYEHNGSQYGRYTYTLNDGQPEFTSEKYVCQNVATFSGTVKYSESTVPVGGANFTVCEVNSNGDVLSEYLLRNSQGELIESNAMGQFQFSVPADYLLKVRVTKKNHKFENDGWITINDKAVFSPEAGKTYAGFQLNDYTRARLVGRICGGNVEADKPLGFSLSRNNIGDELKMELQLEGNNTSWIVYNQDDLDNTTVEKEFAHAKKAITTVQIQDLETGEMKDSSVIYQPKTKVTYEKKRIIVNVDSVTGEFFVDLIPTKYRVTGLSAVGYPTLYGEGEGFDIVDLTDSCDIVTVQSPSGTESYERNASYVRPYHIPATITYEQYKYGQMTGYLGEDKIERMNLAGEEVEHKVASYDAKTRTAHYTFGYPVFESGKSYILQAYAHEDFYYNNDKLNKLDEVPLDSGVLHVQNGLLDNQTVVDYQLNSNGRYNFSFIVGNPTFALSGDNALRSMNVSVELNDYYYEAEPLKAFVTGHRQISTDAQPIATLESGITVLDVLRDPPGKSSYSYRESGTTYNWKRDYAADYESSFTMNLGFGSNGKANVGTGFMLESHTGLLDITSEVNANVEIPLLSVHERINGQYEMSLNERVQTSADPDDVGAMSDVYIGVVDVLNFYRTQSFDLIDETTFQMRKQSIESGAIKLISQGTDADGNNHYMVISDIVGIQDNVMKSFIYTQKHILGTVIPEIDRQIENLLVDGDSVTLQRMADQAGKAFYMRDNSNEYGYKYIKPSETIDGMKDEVAELLASRANWIEVIYNNEFEKVYMAYYTEPLNSYSLSAGADVSYSESRSAFYSYRLWLGNMDPKIDIEIEHDINPAEPKDDKDKKDEDEDEDDDDDWDDDDWDDDDWDDEDWDDEEDENQELTPEQVEEILNELTKEDNQEEEEDDDYEQEDPDEVLEDQKDGSTTKEKAKPKTIDIEALGLKITYAFESTETSSKSNSSSFARTISEGYGFSLGTNDNGYMDVDVYGAVWDIIDWDVDADAINWIQRGSQDGEWWVDEAQMHNFAFYTRGGAGRNPWYEPDSTLFLTDLSGNRIPLGERLLKIDNPRIYVDHPIVNNQPEDTDAEFRVRFTNDSEINTASQYLNGSSFNLYVDDRSNPNGAVIKMDGVPLKNGTSLFINPGNTIEKTIKVERGSGYEFENLKLLFQDASGSLCDEASISIHYLPVATTVNITSPENKWTMNTLSSYDVEYGDKKYYVPVNIDGFNVNSDGFHHIELQYKKNTDGESKWTNVCGFYNDSTLYREATGKKEMIPATGKISGVKFYGEADPIEMSYDLRAVAYRKVGTGFVTRASEVIQGVKDTRCPTVFGTPSPANGILTASDVITIPFNEPIAYNYLDKIANFQVTGYTNHSALTNMTTLSFPRTEGESGAVSEDNIEEAVADRIISSGSIPTTKVTRNLSGNDFTIDALVKVTDDNIMGGEIFSIYNDTALRKTAGQLRLQNNGMIFAIINKHLVFYYQGYAWYSVAQDKIDFTDRLVRLGVTFKQPTDNTPAEANFFVNGVQVDMLEAWAYNDSIQEKIDPSTIYGKCTAEGNIRIGRGFVGSMSDVRFWNRALPGYEVTQAHESAISSNELGIFGYWPISEGHGQVAHDIINGADLYFNRQSWSSSTDQYSLKLDGKKVKLSNAENIERQQSYDYTVSLWARADELTADSVDIFSTGEINGSQLFRIRAAKDGYLNLETKNEEIGGMKTHQIATTEMFADQKWHSIIVVGNKSQNMGAIYFDGYMVNNFNGTELGGLASTNITLGDAGFHGNVDNVSVWNHALPSNSISTLYNRTADGHEMGLVLNLPFEKDKQGSNGRYQTVFSGQNMVYKLESKKANGTYPECDSVFVFADESESKAFIAAHADNITYCPLEAVTGMENLEFDWTSTDNGLQINLKQNDAEINHNNVSIVVRGIEDVAGNTLQNAQRLVLYVDKNVLRWKDKRLTIDKPYRESATTSVKFTNESGSKMSYVLYDYCSWLKLSNETGYIEPLDEKEIQITIDEGLAPGEYSTSIYLVDEKLLVAQLPITVTVVASEPEWAVTTESEYSQQMTLTGQVRLKNSEGVEYTDTDERDVLYAFYNGTCLGKSNISVEDNNAYVYMTIKGSNSMLEQTVVRDGDTITYPAAAIEFRLWRADKGETSFLDPSYVDGKGDTQSVIRFAKNANLGKRQSPVVFTPTTKSVQFFNLKKGWNWISFNVDPRHKLGVNNLFLDDHAFTVGDRFGTLTSNTYSSLQKDYKWSGETEGILKTRNSVYQVYANSDCSPSIAGYLYADSLRYVTLENKGWNGLAYLGTESKPIAYALSDYAPGDKAKEGTVIMSRDEFAQVDGGKWCGSLKYMHPGQGYYINHLGEPGEKITFASENTTTLAAAPRKAAAQSQNVVGISKQYVGSMPVIATFAEGSEYLEGDELVAYANGEEVGRATLQTLDDGRQRFFIMLSAVTGSQVTWAQERSGETVATAKSAVKYGSMTIAGSVESPLAIDFLNGTDSGADVQYFGADGVRVLDASGARQQILIGNDGSKIINK